MLLTAESEVKHFEHRPLETLDLIGSRPHPFNPLIYFDLYFNTAYAAHDRGLLLIDITLASDS